MSPHESSLAAENGAPGGDRVLALCAGLVSALAHATLGAPLSNIDDYNLLPFQRSFLGGLAELVSADRASARFRPLYWLFEGALGAATGSSGTLLHLGRLAFLVMGVAVLVAIARRLGASRPLALLLALAAAWNPPATLVWTRGGPGEAFAVPIAFLAILLALRARGAASVAAAAGLGLAACLTKEACAPLTAAALLARALQGRLRREEGGAPATAVSGAVLQLAPAAAALLLAPRVEGSYVDHVVIAAGGSPAAALRSAVEAAPVLVLLGLLGALPLLARLLRRRPSDWTLEDLLPLAVAGGALSAALALGFRVPRYHVPLLWSCSLLAARGGASLEAALRAHARPRLLAAVLLVPLAAVVAAAGARAVTYAAASRVDHRVDAAFRDRLRASFAAFGGVHAAWPPGEVEQVIGALAHLRSEGTTGPAWVEPCAPFPYAAEATLAPLFHPYSRPLDRPAPILVSTACPGARSRDGLPTALLVLPNLGGVPVGYHRITIPDRARVLAPEGAARP